MSGDSAFAWQNWVTTATVTAGSEEASLPADNIKTPYGADQYAWQTADGVVTAAGGATLTITPTGSALTWRAIVLARTNLTAAAEITATLWNSPSTSVWTDTFDGPPAHIGQALIVLPSDTTADYLTLEIDDAANPDNCIRVALVFAGPLWRPGYGRTTRSPFGRQSRVDIQVTLGGQEFATPRWDQRWVTLDFDATSAADEVWQYAMELDRVARLGTNVLAIPNLSSDTIAYETVFGLMKTSEQMSYPQRNPSRVAWNATVRERL